MKLILAFCFSLLFAVPAMAQPIEISSDALAKAAQASDVKAKANAMKESLVDSAGFVIVVLDKDGGQRGGQVLVKTDDPAWDAVRAVVDAAVVANESTADAMLTEAGVRLKGPPVDAD